MNSNDFVVPVRMKREHRDQIKNAADFLGVPVSVYMRMASLAVSRAVQSEYIQKLDVKNDRV